MLEARDLEVDYGAAPAVWGVSLDISPGELVCIVGPNGAGKSTLINALAGLHRISAGRITMDGRDLTALPTHRYCSAGIAIVPEGRRLFTRMSVRENLAIGSYAPAARHERARTLERVCSLFPAVRDKLDAPAGALSGGQQQMVAIGRALMARPRIVLFDEPSLGLAPTVVDDMFEIIARVRDEGTAVLLVEQNVLKALDIADRAYVLEQGRFVAQGLPADLLKQPQIREAYLGV